MVKEPYEWDALSSSSLNVTGHAGLVKGFLGSSRVELPLDRSRIVVTVFGDDTEGTLGVDIKMKADVDESGAE